jgi:tRNA (guanine-N1)-methyltransferase
MICGRYEGVMSASASTWRTARFPSGDFVLSGGELGAAIIVDTVSGWFREHWATRHRRSRSRSRRSKV